MLYRPCREHPARVTIVHLMIPLIDHERLAVILGPGFTGLCFVFEYFSSLLCRFRILQVLALTRKKPLLIKGFS
jgi:hypothetical protein